MVGFVLIDRRHLFNHCAKKPKKYIDLRKNYLKNRSQIPQNVEIIVILHTLKMRWGRTSDF